MKMFLVLFSICSSTMFGSVAVATDTDDIRAELLIVRDKIDRALAKLGQTRFSESSVVPRVIQGQCVADQSDSGYRFNKHVDDATAFVKARAMAKCGSNCSMAVSYTYQLRTGQALDAWSCKVTAVATKP